MLKESEPLIFNTQTVPASEVSGCEVNMILDAFLYYGYDFRHHARAPLQRRLQQCRKSRQLVQLSELIPGILHDAVFRRGLLDDMSISVTDLFRDPEVFLALRGEVVSWLRTHPFLRIWVAGCATGEEAYSMAILLQEEGLYGRARIYATDRNSGNLQVAREGLYPLDQAVQFQRNLAQSGSVQPLSKYMEFLPKQLRVHDDLRENIVFADHDLVSDGVFGQMHLVLCRNVLIYFNQELRDRVLDLLETSLVPLGSLCLGKRESLETSLVNDHFEVIAAADSIYRKRAI